MRERDLASLDFPRIREILASFTQTPIGRERAENLVPFATQKEAEGEFLRLAQLGDANCSLSGIKDVRRILLSLKEGTVLPPIELLDILQTLSGLSELERLPRDLIPSVADFSNLLKKIRETIDENGEIKSTSSPLLQELIREAALVREGLIKRLEALRKESPHLFWEGEITVKNGRYCLPLKSGQKGKIPGIVHDISESEKTFFIEPLPLVETGNQLIRIEKEIEEEKRRILRELTEEVNGKKDSILSLLALAGEIDLLLSKREFARRFGGVKPQFAEDLRLEIIGAKHPLLLLQGRDVTPLDLKMDKKKVLVVSGPNAGGKTCLLKTIGVVSLLSQCGIFPPAERVILPFFENIFTDIGESESLEEAVSAFTSHLLNIKEILEKEDGNSLYLIDEIGSATSPEEGAALACALIETFRERKGITIITTHLTAVKVFAYDQPDILQGGMEFRGRPTYRLILGLPGESSALEVASLLSFPEAVINRAKNFLKERFLSLKEKIKRLEKEIATYEELNRKLREKEKERSELSSLLERRLKETAKREKELRREILQEKERFLKENRKRIEEIIEEIKRTKAEEARVKMGRETIEAIAQSIREERRRLITHKGEVRVGAVVYIPWFGKTGRVVELNKSSAKIIVGKMILTIPAGELELVEDAQERAIVPEKRKETDFVFSPLLNLRGEEKVFALEKVERFLEDACFYGTKEVKILHGKGEGILQRAIWEFLKGDQRVLEFREGRPEEGGYGVTVVKLR